MVDGVPHSEVLTGWGRTAPTAADLERWSADIRRQADAAIALRGMSSFFADRGSWASVIPPSALIASRPRVPSDPIPDRMTPMLWLPCASARDWRNASMGMCAPPVLLRGTSFSIPSAKTMSCDGGMT